MHADHVYIHALPHTTHTHTHTHICSLLSLSSTTTPIPSLKVITEHEAELPVLYSNFPLALYFTHAIGEGDGTPLQYSCLENPMDGGAW